MTSAVALQHSTSLPITTLPTATLPTTLHHPRRVQPRGFDRLVIRVSVAMLRWARRRSERSLVPYDELVLRNRVALETERRQRSELPIALRLL